MVNSFNEFCEELLKSGFSMAAVMPKEFMRLFLLIGRILFQDVL